MVSKRITRSSSKLMKILEQIPVDLIIEILSKLPVKSIARFRCISKHWNSILCSPIFINLFFKMSSSRPRLLFAVLTEGKWLYLSAPEPLNPNKNSSPLTIDYHIWFPSISLCSVHLFAPINGLLCIGCNDFKVMIFNPSTRQSIQIQLPIMSKLRVNAITFLGYDPINQQYKVLCLSIRQEVVIKYEVLTLGIEKPVWKIIECSLPQHYPYSPICINGVLYYLGNHGSRNTLVCFDVRSEKINFIETDDKVRRLSKLINYKGKLGVLRHVGDICGKTKSLELLVLDDVEKNQWSQYSYVLPPLWKDLVADTILKIAGMTRNGELVFSPKVVCDPFYVFFYNLEKNTIARLRIQGMESTRPQFIQTFIDHVENVKLI